MKIILLYISGDYVKQPNTKRLENESYESYKARIFEESRRIDALRAEQSNNYSLLKRGILKLDMKLRQRWDMLILLLTTGFCAILPFDMAFDDKVELESMHQFLFVVDLFFIMDVILNFRTTFRHTYTNVEITDPKEIAINYIQGQFLFDLVSAVPLDYIM